MKVHTYCRYAHTCINGTQQHVCTAHMHINIAQYKHRNTATLNALVNIIFLYIPLKPLMRGRCFCCSVTLFHNFTPTIEMQKLFMVKFLFRIL